MTPGEIEIEIAAWDDQQERLDYRAALICALIAETHRNIKEHPKPFTPEDFMPGRADKETEPKQQQTVEDMLGIMQEMKTVLAR